VLLPDGTSVTIGYDPVKGRMQSITMPTGTIALGYNATSGRLSSATGPSGVNLAFTHDGDLLKSTTWSGAVAGSVTRNYDNFFRLSSEQVNTTPAVTFNYNDDGLMTQAGAMSLSYSATNTQLLGTTLGQVTDTRTYDAFGDLDTYSASFGTTPLYSYDVTRDDVGRIIHKVETIQGTTTEYEYEYDNVGRLVGVAINGVVTREYVYDDNGNRTAYKEFGVTVATGIYNAQDQLLSYGNFTYTYDANGALRTKTNTATSQTTTYAYDNLGNLLQVNLPDGRVIQYLVDAMGRRVGKKVNGVMVKGWLYRDDLRPVAELDGAGNVVSRFVWADGLGAEDCVVRSVLGRIGVATRLSPARGNLPQYVVKGTSVYRFVTDHLGSPRLLADITTGTVAQRVDRDEWGRTLSDSAPAFQPFGFAAGMDDADIELLRFGARDYDSRYGRWVSKDPMRFPGGLNFYEYVGSDPSNSRDIRGMIVDLSDAIGHVIGGVGVIFGGDLPRATSTPSGTVCEYRNNPIQDLFGASTTYGHTINYASGADEATRAHELAHTEQHTVLGFLYLPLHVWSQLISYATTGTYDEGNLLELGPSSAPPRPWF
jgi:RHS repeat-associated protein